MVDSDVIIIKNDTFDGKIQYDGICDKQSIEMRFFIGDKCGEFLINLNDIEIMFQVNQNQQLHKIYKKKDKSYKQIGRFNNVNSYYCNRKGFKYLSKQNMNVESISCKKKNIVRVKAKNRLQKIFNDKMFYLENKILEKNQTPSKNFQSINENDANTKKLTVSIKHSGTCIIKTLKHKFYNCILKIKLVADHNAINIFLDSDHAHVFLGCFENSLHGLFYVKNFSGQIEVKIYHIMIFVDLNKLVTKSKRKKFNNKRKKFIKTLMFTFFFIYISIRKNIILKMMCRNKT
ncbi:hypothetical protein COBT_001561 [Conglomerata obtusa]